MLKCHLFIHIHLENERLMRFIYNKIVKGVFIIARCTAFRTFIRKSSASSRTSNSNVSIFKRAHLTCTRRMENCNMQFESLIANTLVPFDKSRIYL